MPLRPTNAVQRGRRRTYWTGTANATVAATTFTLPVQRPISSPRRLTPGRAITPTALPRVLPPIQTHGWKPLIGSVVRRNGVVYAPKGPPQGPPPPWRPPTSVQRPVSSPRRLTPGRVLQASALARIVPPIQTHGWQPTIGSVVRRNGVSLQPKALPRVLPPIQTHGWKPLFGAQVRRNGRAIVPPALPPQLPPLQTHGWQPTIGRVVRRAGDVWIPSGLILTAVTATDTPLRGLSTIGSVVRRRGAVYLPKGPPEQPPAPRPALLFSGPLVPTTIVRWAPRVRWRPTGGVDAPRNLPPIVRPVCSPRRMTAGRAILPRVPSPLTDVGHPPGSVVRPVASPRRMTPGRTFQARALPPQAARIQTGGWKPLIGRVVRRRGWVYRPAGPSLGAPTPGLPPSSVLRPVSSPRRLRGGLAAQARYLPRVLPPIQAHPWKPAIGGQPRRRGQAIVPKAFPPAFSPLRAARWTPTYGQVVRRPGRITLSRIFPSPAALVFTLPRSPIRPSCLPNPRRQGRSYVPRPVGIDTPIGRFPRGLVVRRSGDDRDRRRRGWTLHWLPIPLEGAIPATQYHVYSNGGSGPINYVTPIATTFGLTWTSPPLAYPKTWKFGVRAFNNFGEEANLDAAVSVVVDVGGTDITLRPLAPIGLRAFARAGGAIRVEWSYGVATLASLPTGFNVYIGSSGTPSYAAPVATVAYSSMLAKSFVANLTGLVNGTTYRIGVRSYNAVAEEPNTSYVTATADSTGPDAVDSLTGTAI